MTTVHPYKMWHSGSSMQGRREAPAIPAVFAQGMIPQAKRMWARESGSP